MTLKKANNRKMVAALMRPFHINLLIGMLMMAPVAMTAQDIVHDAEYYILKAQHGTDWSVQDREVDKKLNDLRQKYGTPPNIIHIMWDDTPMGEVGIPELQKLRGFNTPNINRLASEGINFMRMYTEPSCTPTRAAAITGRHPVRNGMYNVGFPYESGGLADEEETIAEILGQAGYATAFYGKSHLGDIEESYMTNQGFDEALWSPYNQVPSMYLPQAEIGGAISPTSMYPEMYPADPYDIDKGWRPKGLVWHLEGTKGGNVTEYLTPDKLENWHLAREEAKKRVLHFIDKNVEGNKPFYIAYWPQLTAFIPFPDRQTLSGGLLQEALTRFDPFVGQLMADLREKGIAENTLVVLMADNGPMTHNGPPGMVETMYRGGKGDYLEGGIRVPAMAWWPGMIEPNQTVGDIIHVTDLFTTFARIGEATQYIPRDRIIDGIDQTSLLLNGDANSRRDYVHVYTGDVYAATVKGRFKRVWVGDLPGLSGASFFDLYNDPREVQPKMLPMFPTKGMFNMMRGRHEFWNERYPHIAEARDFPFKGVSDPRREVSEASKPRVNPDDLPFDPVEILKQQGLWRIDESDWGIDR